MDGLMELVLQMPKGKFEMLRYFYAYAALAWMDYINRFLLSPSTR